MKIVIDNKIPYIKGVLEPFAKVLYCNGADIDNQLIKDADAIVIRTRTQCNSKLLESTSVKLIVTATIGFDHIDTDYCRKSHIKWVNAPGCNSSSVEQYVAAALVHIATKQKLKLSQLTIGIIGVGNVGSKIARIAKLLSMKVLLNDPPRARKEGNDNFVSLEEIKQKSDIISLHVPLNKTGIDANFHLINEPFIHECTRHPFIINTCRGEVTDSIALINGMKTNRLQGLIIDCWENEPNINDELLELATIATPHIAGYSKDGKANGTSHSIQALSAFFNFGINNWKCINIEEPKTNEINLNGKDKTTQEIVTEAILATYKIDEDSKLLQCNKSQFENLRGSYPVRREFPFYIISALSVNNTQQKLLSNIGFQVIMK
ncbi:MAG: 4-phosphoerythronate dehydrogenase [Mangrovibacterium sp.]